MVVPSGPPFCHVAAASVSVKVPASDWRHQSVQTPLSGPSRKKQELHVNDLQDSRNGLEWHL